MLVVNPEKRFTVDQCLRHPWMTGGTPNANDSTDGLVPSLAGLEVGRRGVVRERTLLSSVKALHKPGAAAADPHHKPPPIPRESRPSDSRAPHEFIDAGGKGDPTLFGKEASHYAKKDIAAAKKGHKKGR